MRLNLLILLLVLLLSFGSLVTAQDEEETPPITVTTTAELRIRSQPTVSGESLQIVPQGTTLLALGRNANTTWIQVNFRGVIGWSSSTYLFSGDDLTTLPVTDATDPSVDPRPEERVSAPDGTLVRTGQLVIFSTLANVNVRALPDEGAPRIGQLSRNERAVVTLVDRSQLWGRIDFQGQQGWVALYVVNVLGDIRTVEVLGKPASSSELPVTGLPEGQFNLEQREQIQAVQNHLARYRPEASGLLDILRQGAERGFIACGPIPSFFRDYTLSSYDQARVPELIAPVNTMNAAFDILNDVRADWLRACTSGQTLLYREQYPTWYQTALTAIPLLDQAENALAPLTAR